MLTTQPGGVSIGALNTTSTNDGRDRRAQAPDGGQEEQREEDDKWVVVKRREVSTCGRDRLAYYAYVSTCGRDRLAHYAYVSTCGLDRLAYYAYVSTCGLDRLAYYAYHGHFTSPPRFASLLIEYYHCVNRLPLSTITTTSFLFFSF